MNALAMLTHGYIFDGDVRLKLPPQPPTVTTVSANPPPRPPIIVVPVRKP